MTAAGTRRGSVPHGTEINVLPQHLAGALGLCKRGQEGQGFRSQAAWLVQEPMFQISVFPLAALRLAGLRIQGSSLEAHGIPIQTLYQAP